MDWLLFAVAAAVWALARPTQGVRHDAVLYWGQVLSRMFPGEFSRDVFFQFGSQDAYSIYSRFLEPAVQAGWANVLAPSLLWFAHLGLLGGVYALLRGTSLNRWLSAAGMVSVAAMSHIYGGRHLIAFGEEFLTARTLAEPLVLLALVLWVRGAALWWVGAALIAATAFHPLIALPGWLVVWVGLCLQSRRWMWLLLVVPLVAGLGSAGVAPFDRVLQRYDDDWWTAVQSFNQMVLLKHWYLGDGLLILLNVIIVAWGGWRIQWALSKLLKSVVLVSLGVLVLSFAMGDLGRNVLIVSLQTWRALWLLHLLALAVWPRLLKEAWMQGPAGKHVALSLVLLATGVYWTTGWAFLLWLALAGWLMCSAVVLPERTWRVLHATTVLALVAVAARTGWLSWEQSQDGGQYDQLVLVEFLMQVPLVALAVGFGMLWMLAQGRRAWTVVGLICVTLALGMGIRGWDQRNAWQRYLDEATYRSHPFQKFVPPQSQVYWDQQVQGAWFLLRRPSYFSVSQGGGVLFNRLTAMEFSKRASHFDMLDAQKVTCQLLGELNGRSDEEVFDSCYPTPEIVEEVCKLEHALDFLVFRRNVGRGVVADWIPPVEAGVPNVRFWLHSCQAFRATDAAQ